MGPVTGADMVIGQQKVKAFLRNSIRRKRLTHAYLFSGPEGAGMDAMAIDLARTVLCDLKGESACGECKNCRLASGLRHPDIHLHFPLPVGRNESADDEPLDRLTPQDLEAVRREVEAKAVEPYHRISIPRANHVKLTSVRSMRRRAAVGSFDTGAKIFIILDAHTMTPEASNALLKTLEEPTPGTLIILTTSEPDALLPTVVSRCQHVRFDTLGEDEIAGALTVRHGLDAAKAAMIGKLSAGSYANALRLIGEDLAGRRNTAVDLLRNVLHRPHRGMVALFDDLAARDRADALEVIVLLETWIRDAMLVSSGRPPEVNVDDAATIGKFTSQYPGFGYGAAIDALEEAVSDLRKNVYIHLVLHALGIRIRDAARGADSGPAR
jgi:DNA polymerase-3 subunit delta'